MQCRSGSWPCSSSRSRTESTAPLMSTGHTLALSAIVAVAVTACGDSPTPPENDPCDGQDCRTFLDVELKGSLAETVWVAVAQSTESRGYRHEVACSPSEPCGNSVRFELDEPGTIWLSYESLASVIGQEVTPEFDGRRTGGDDCPTGCREGSVTLEVPEAIGPDVQVEDEGHELSGVEVRHLARHQTWLYAATDHGVYRRDLSVTNTSWSALGLQDQDVAGGIVIFDPDTLLAGVGMPYGVGVPYRSSDGGATWVAATSDTTVRDVQDLGLVGDSVVIAATLGGARLYRSTDQGRTWHATEEIYVDGQNVAPLASGHVFALDVDPRHPALVWATGETGWFGPDALKSSDAGTTWTGIAFSGEAWPGEGWALSVAVDPTDASRAWAGISNRLIRTETGGEDWRRGWHTMFITTGRAIPSVGASEALPGRVWCFFTPPSGAAILAVSDDGGDTWAKIPVGQHDSGEMVAVASGGRERLYVASADGVYVYGVVGP